MSFSDPRWLSLLFAVGGLLALEVLAWRRPGRSAARRGARSGRGAARTPHRCRARHELLRPALAFAAVRRRRAAGPRGVGVAPRRARARTPRRRPPRTRAAAAAPARR